MALDPKLNALAVDLNGRRVGIINRLAGDQHIFSFEQEYLDDVEHRPTLSLSFKGSTGRLISRVRPISRRVPPFFSNLLPEGHLRAYLAERAGVKTEREFFLLAALGADLPGAVTVAPLAADGHALQDAELNQPDGEGDRQEGILRFSLAGVQLKFSAVMESSGGLTIPAHGVGGSWIVKLPSSQYPAVPENEYVMLALARAVGLTVPETRLVAIRDIGGLPAEVVSAAWTADSLGPGSGQGSGSGAALAVKRFDRTDDGGRIHMEDFAQVFGLFPDEKYGRRSYANIAAVLRAEVGESGTNEFVRRLAFSVLIGNGDMHLKNWSLLYPTEAEGRKPMLSPAYDFVATLPYIPGDKLGLRFGGSQSLDEITADQVRRFAETARLAAAPLWTIVEEMVERTVEAWRGLVERDLLPRAMRGVVERQIFGVAAKTIRSDVRRREK